MTCPTAELTRDRLVSLMVGRELSQFFPQRPAPSAASQVALAVSDYVAGAGQAASRFQLNRHEIVGLTGLEGQGQREVIRALAGLRPLARACVKYDDATGEAKTLLPPSSPPCRPASASCPKTASRRACTCRCRSPRISASACCAATSMVSPARLDRSASNA